MKILLKKVNFGSHTIGEVITSPKDLSTKEAEYLVGRDWAESVGVAPEKKETPEEIEAKRIRSQYPNIYKEFLELAKGKGFNRKLHENAKEVILIAWMELQKHRKEITSEKLLEDLQQDATQKKEEIPDKISSKALRIILETVEVSDAQKDKTDSS